MKNKLERLGTDRVRARIEKINGRTVTAILLTVILAMSILSAYFAYSIFNTEPTNQTSLEPSSRSEPEEPTPDLNAAIVDQLSLAAPNQTFIDVATNTLMQTGYTVDYFKSENVTVKLYRDLPWQRYRVVIFRVHSGYNFLFTGEKYDAQKYISEQLSDQIVKVQVNSNSDSFFGVADSFIRQCVHSNFTETLVILMGCSVLYWPDMARAFIQRGAGAVVGWTGEVYSSQTDEATTILLKCVQMKMHLDQAVSETNRELGIDSLNQNHLAFYLGGNQFHFH